MDLSTSLARLAKGIKDLRAIWEEVAPTWNDSMKQRYEDRHVDPLLAAALAAQREMDRLNQTMRQARMECERR